MMVSNARLAEPFKIRAQRHTVMILYITEPENPKLIQLLENKIKSAENFFNKSTVIIDLEEFTEEQGSLLEKILTFLKTTLLIPIGVQNGNPIIQARASLMGFPLIPPQGSSLVDLCMNKESRKKAEPVPENPRKKTLIIQDIVRSGQQIYAEGGDLVCLRPVSAGADLRADGNIHVYSSLRGRAFAGVKGDTEARIFCSSFQAQLVQIADLYVVNEQIDDQFSKQNVHIYIQDGQLRCKKLV